MTLLVERKLPGRADTLTGRLPSSWRIEPPSKGNTSIAGSSGPRSPRHIPVGYAQGRPAGAAWWKVIGQVPVQFTRLLVNQVGSYLLQRQRMGHCL